MCVTYGAGLTLILLCPLTCIQSGKPHKAFYAVKRQADRDDRKHEFHPLLGGRVLRPPFGAEHPTDLVHALALCSLCFDPGSFILEHHRADIRQVAVGLGIVNPVADDKGIGNFKSGPCGF